MIVRSLLCCCSSNLPLFLLLSALVNPCTSCMNGGGGERQRNLGSDALNDYNRHLQQIKNANDISNATSRSRNINNSKNPYYRGCLHEKLGEQKKKMRVCNSEDSKDAAALGLCRSPPIDEYMEIRIFCQDWESVSFTDC